MDTTLQNKINSSRKAGFFVASYYAYQVKTKEKAGI